MTVGELGEHALIQRLSRATPPAPPSVPVGIGDDAAVVEPERGALTVVTTDALLEGIHFDRAFTAASDVGHKALAVNLSDLAAMGAAPRHALLSLGLPDTLLVNDFDALLHDLLMLLARHRMTLIGGNITRSNGPLFVDVTAMGSVKRRRVLTRSGAKAGDEIYVSGHLGGAAAGLSWLQHATAAQRASDDYAICRQRYLRPEPRVRLGMLLGRNRVTRCLPRPERRACRRHPAASLCQRGRRRGRGRRAADPNRHARMVRRNGSGPGGGDLGGWR